MKYKVGDKVKVREDLEVDKRYGTEEFLEDIEEEKSIGQIIDDILSNPEMILKQANRIATKAKEALEKIERENKELKATIIEKEKYIEYLRGEIDGMLLIKNKEV